jgi:uncharacterized protein YecE (DUF72 family)
VHMDASPLYLGTSSWTAVGWETAFYPPRTKEADYLSFYATKFNSVEVDSTFYRIPAAKTVNSGGNERQKGLSLRPSSLRLLPTRRS